jgi:hypothetical protein
MRWLPRSTELQAAFSRIGLPAWFLAIDLLWIANVDNLGIDARHYQRAAAEWLSGGNPWSVAESGIPYASGPHTLLFYAPTSQIPMEVSTFVWTAAGLAAAVWVVRRLGLPVWWVAFPPLAHAVWNGNPHAIVVALLVASTWWASALAAGFKLYAGLQLLFRPRQLVAAGMVLAVTLPLIPWQLYLDVGLGVSSHIATAWNGSAWQLPILIPPTLLALWVIRNRGAEWFIVPAVFPATQFYYVSTVLPAVANRPLLAAVTALPVPLLVPAVVMFLAAAPRLGKAFAPAGAQRLDPRTTHS